MGRETQQTTEAIVLPDLPVAHLQEVQQMGSIALDLQQAHVRAIALQVGYQLPGDMIDPDLIQRDIASNMRRSVEACLEVGRGLTVLKAACIHGQFTARLDVLGIDKYVASRFIQSATKFSKLPSNATLTKAIGNQTKLFEMLVLDDEQIEELELTGQTGELKLDDVATMSVKELRKTLREARESLTDKDRVLETRNGKIDELDQALIRTQRQVQAMSPLDIGEQIRSEASAMASKAEIEVRSLKAALSALQAHGDKNAVSHSEVMAGLIAQVQLALNQLRDEFDIKALPDGEIEPEWVREEADDALAKFKRQQAALPLDSELHHGNVLSPVES
ncbi:hypothetical protein [uncultured Deefgea sp.]|uniref:hypothetical protein n=1 Tax=uncultured Deefgea sp. TaxID=1304914 RepID=UPI00262853B5|nr:hypothetical protein [uncultured Deefgea sp.]